jgi:hypothetical protein
MASMTGYFSMIVGLSLLLGMAGVGTLGGHLLGLFGLGITNGVVTGLSNSNTLQNAFLATFLGILTSLGVLGVGVLAGRFDIGAALKVGVLTTTLGLIFADIVGIIVYCQTVGNFGVVVGGIIAVVYVPLLFMFGITAMNWVGGNQ